MAKKFFSVLLSLTMLMNLFPLSKVFATSNPEILVGINTPFAPFEKEVNGEYVGYDIDVMNYICSKLNLKPKYIDMDFDQLMPSLISGEIDCIISAITATETRVQYADFTRPYFVGRFVYPEEKIDVFERLSIALPKGSGYRQQFNDIIFEAEKSGVFKNIATKYNLVYDDTMASTKDTSNSPQYIIYRDDRSVTTTDKSGKYLLEYYYDKIILNPSIPNSEKINRLIQKDCDEFFGDDDGSWVIDSPPMYENEVYVNGCQAIVTKNDGNIFSIKIRTDWYAGGVHNAGYYGLNYNLKTGTELTLSDIFTMSDEELLRYIKDCSKRYIDQHPDMYWWNDNFQNAKQIVDKYSLSDFEFYLEGDNVCICYPVYELGPGAMGPVIIECPIKSEEISPILKGDFSEFAGTYKYNNGHSFELLADGLLDMDISDEETEYRVEDIEKRFDGTYSWSINSYYHEECMDGTICILYPKGVEVLSYDGRILPTDTSKVRFWSGNAEVADAQYIAYKDDEVLVTTITDDTVLKAEILNRNHSFDFYRNTAQSPAVMLNKGFRENSTQEWANAYMFTYELSKILSLNFPDVEKFDMKSYYEAVLTDVLENDNASIWSDFYSNWKNIYNGYNNKLLQEIIKTIPDFKKYKESDLAKETDIKIVIVDKIKDSKGEFKDIKVEKNFFETFGFAYDTITDTFDVIDEIYAYSAVQQEKIDVLNVIKNNTDNTELAKACESIIERIQDVHKNVITAFLKNEGITVGKNLLELSQSVTIDLLLQIGKTTSAADIISDYSRGKLIMSTARLATDLIMNATSVSKDTLTIAAYSDIESEIKRCIEIAQNNFESNKNIDNARSYMATADVFKAALLTSCDLYSKCVENVKRGDAGVEIASIIGTMGVSGIINSIWGNDINYDEKIKQSESIKSYIIDADFYSTNGTDVVEYISNIVSTTPSEWATKYVDKAIEYNILPYDYLRGNYQNNITRAEFCTLLYYTISEFMGEDAYLLIEKSSYRPKLFKDTYYEYVYYMACLGIVNGISETEFNPLGEITREEAATMLMRAAKVTGCAISAPSTNLQGVSTWATDGVNFVVDRNIMTGTDVGFEPQGKYTKEQAITTFVRFIENLK